MTISSLSDTGVSPGRRFQPLIIGLAAAIWALTHFTGHDSRNPSGLTLAYRLRIPFIRLVTVALARRAEYRDEGRDVVCSATVTPVLPNDRLHTCQSPCE